MNKKIFSLFLITFLLISPFFSLAQPKDPFGGNPPILFSQMVTNVLTIILTLLWIVGGAFVTIMFVLAGFKFLTAPGEPTKVSEARKMVLWGLVGAAVMILAWSVTSIVQKALLFGAF